MPRGRLLRPGGGGWQSSFQNSSIPFLLNRPLRHRRRFRNHRFSLKRTRRRSIPPWRPVQSAFAGSADLCEGHPFVLSSSASHWGEPDIDLISALPFLRTPPHHLYPTEMSKYRHRWQVFCSGPPLALPLLITSSPSPTHLFSAAAASLHCVANSSGCYKDPPLSPLSLPPSLAPSTGCSCTEHAQCISPLLCSARGSDGDRWDSSAMLPGVPPQYRVVARDKQDSYLRDSVCEPWRETILLFDRCCSTQMLTSIEKQRAQQEFGAVTEGGGREA